MNKNFEGVLLGKGLRFGVVISRINEFITNRLLEGARDALFRHGVNDEDMEIAWVPGSFEIPLVSLKLAQTKRFDAIICLGALIRRGTPHFDLVAAEATKGIAKVSLETGVPIIHGIITTDTLEQAVERAGTTMGNRGFEAAISALEMANLLKSLS